MKRLGFRGRLLIVLFCFAVVPSALLLVAWGATSGWVLSMVGATAAWDSVGATGHRAIEGARRAPLDSAARVAIAQHETLLDESIKKAKQTEFFIHIAPKAAIIAALIVLALLSFIASRVAGHLSRNLSRPLQELVGWTTLIGQAKPLPTGPPRRGAPEFEVLRTRMRSMSAELQQGQARALEAERGAALRESARQFAHELKNPLTPIRFAVERLRRDAPPALAESVEVLAVETRRLDAMARSFSQFGRLPEGPTADVDLGDLARYAIRSAVPEHIESRLDVGEGLPMIRGHYEALARALSNVVLNAVDACGGGTAGVVGVRLIATRLDERPAVEIAVHDTGRGIPPDRLAHIWTPYVTSKPGGTGLGLAIARQTVLAHGGQVSAESEPTRGTTIRFILPVHATTGAETNGDHG